MVSTGCARGHCGPAVVRSWAAAPANVFSALLVLLGPDEIFAVRCLLGLGGPPSMFKTVRWDAQSGGYAPCSDGEGCEAIYTNTAREVECPEVPIHYNGYHGTAAGYCETYTLNITSTASQRTASWLGSEGAGQLTYSQCQDSPMNLKPGHRHTCEQQLSLHIDDGLSWESLEVRGAGSELDSSWDTERMLLEQQVLHDFTGSSPRIFIASKECCSTDEDDSTACNAGYANSIPTTPMEVEGGFGGLVILLLVIMPCVLYWKCKVRCPGTGQRYEMIVQVDGRTTSAQKLRTGPGKFKPVAEQFRDEKLPMGTMVTINSLDPEMDAKGLPWLHVSVSTKSEQVVSGYLPKTAVEQIEATAPPPSCCARLCGGDRVALVASEDKSDGAKSPKDAEKKAMDESLELP